MAETSSLTFEKCILWKTWLPPELDEIVTSTSFLVQDSEWHLELSHSDCDVTWPPFCYIVSLSRYYGVLNLDDELENTFEVSTFMQKDDHILLPSGEPQIKLVDRECNAIALFHESSIRKRWPDIGFDEDVFIVCRFRLPASDVSCHNEKIEVTTQTDFDRPLPVKNLHDAKPSSDDNLDSLSQDLCKLLEDKVLPDINLKCGDRTVAAHKAILATRSQVFSVMFQSRMLESETGVVDITDVNADVLETFLKYVYSGRLSDVTDESLPSLYAAADKYNVSALKSTCSERMVSNLTRENCLNILLLANAHSDQDLENAVLEFILNQTDILKSQEWMKFRKDNPILSNEVLQFVLQQKLF